MGIWTGLGWPRIETDGGRLKRRMRWEGSLARLVERSGIYGVVVGKTEGKA